MSFVLLQHTSRQPVHPGVSEERSYRRRGKLSQGSQFDGWIFRVGTNHDVVCFAVGGPVDQHGDFTVCQFHPQRVCGSDHDDAQQRLHSLAVTLVHRWVFPPTAEELKEWKPSEWKWSDQWNLPLPPQRRRSTCGWGRTSPRCASRRCCSSPSATRCPPRRRATSPAWRCPCCSRGRRTSCGATWRTRGWAAAAPCPGTSPDTPLRARQAN